MLSTLNQRTRRESPYQKLVSYRKFHVNHEFNELHHESNKKENTSLAEQFENIIVNSYKQTPNDNTPINFMNGFLHVYSPCVLKCMSPV